jgi:hypothetical protein
MCSACLAELDVVPFGPIGDLREGDDRCPAVHVETWPVPLAPDEIEARLRALIDDW